MKALSHFIFLAAFLSMPVMPFAQTCVTPGQDIIAWWSFDDTTSAVVEDIAGNHDGVFVDGTIYSSGEVNHAATFTESNYVGIADDDVWAWGSNNFSIEFWAALSNPGGNLQHPGDIFICTSNGPGETDKWWFALGNGVLSFHVNHTSPFWYAQTPFSPVLNQWYHLAVTRSGDTLRVYIDGTLSGTEVVPGLFIYNPNAPLTLGIGEGIGLMTGALDEMTIYSRALSGEEIQAIYSAGTSGKCKSLQITTPLLSDVKFGESFSQTLQAQFGEAPFAWSIVSGQLPNGVTFSEDGILSGAPQQAGEFPITIQVTDSLGTVADKEFTLKVLLTLPPPELEVNKSGTVAVPGREMDYFISVENVGTTVDTFRGVELLEPWFTYISSYPAAEITDYMPNALTADSTDSIPAIIKWEVDLAPGEAQVLTYKVKLDAYVPVGVVVKGPWCWDNITPSEAQHCTAIYMECLLGASAKAALECEPTFILGPEAYGACYTAKMAQGIVVCLALYGGCMSDAGIGNPCTEAPDTTKGALDPNEMLVLADKYIHQDQLLTYVTEFENIGNIEAQDVFVTDVLDSALDATTLNILSSDGSSYDPLTRTLRWDLYGINLEVDSSAYVIYSIHPKQSLSSGTIIPNQATIQFEVFDPINTNQVVNIIDYSTPSGVMDPLPEEINQSDFTISWSGTDSVGAIKDYTIFVAIDSGSYTVFLANTTQTSSLFTGEAGKTYHFICIARDSAGNSEIQGSLPEATTRINTFCTPVSPGSLTTTAITASSVRLKWDAVPGAEGYKIRYKEEGSSEWVKKVSAGAGRKLDNLSPNTKYAWQVKAVCSIESNSSSDWSTKHVFTTDPLRTENNSPELIALDIYPDPASDYAVIEFTLPEATHTLIKVYDMSGKERETLANEYLAKGMQSFTLNTSDFSKGVYLVKLITDFGTENEKVIVE